MLPIATVVIIKGNPMLNHLMKLIGLPYFSLIPAATTPALELIKVPFPPRSAPKANAYHSGLMWKPPKVAAVSALPLSV